MIEHDQKVNICIHEGTYTGGTSCGLELTKSEALLNSENEGACSRAWKIAVCWFIEVSV